MEATSSVGIPGVDVTLMNGGPHSNLEQMLHIGHRQGAVQNRVGSGLQNGMQAGLQVALQTNGRAQAGMQAGGQAGTPMSMQPGVQPGLQLGVQMGMPATMQQALNPVIQSGHLSLEQPRKAVWVRFKHGRPTEVEVEAADVHIDHFKKRLKGMFPRHLAHLEAFEFSIKQDPTDASCIPEDCPLDSLRANNRASTPLYIDTPDAVMETVPVVHPIPSASPAAALAVAPPPRPPPPPLPPLAVESGAAEPPSTTTPSANGAEGLLSGPAAAIDVGAPRPRGRPKGSTNAGSGGKKAPSGALKKAADGLSKGHGVVLLRNGEEVGRGRILSCERGGHCKLRLRTFSGAGSAVTPDGKCLREVGGEDFLWPRSDCKRDYRIYEPPDNSG